MFLNAPKFRFFSNLKNAACENPHGLILFSVCLLTFYSNLSTAQEVAPLKKGNFWIYDYFFQTELRISVVDDNVIIDTISYFHVTDQSNHLGVDFSRYFRIRPDGYYVVRLDTSYPAPNHEKLYYKKNALIGDEWVNPTDFLPMYYSIIDTFIASVFGELVTVKVLEIDAGVVFFNELWTEEYGKLNREDIGSGLQYTLRGCRIDSFVYGDTTFVVGIEYENFPVSSFELDQNYPNPFNPTTTIEYSIKQDGLVSLKVYDVLGNEVVSLVNENKVAGNYSVQFDASNLPSGIYIYRLTSGQFTSSKKLILLK